MDSNTSWINAWVRDAEEGGTPWVDVANMAYGAAMHARANNDDAALYEYTRVHELACLQIDNHRAK